MIHAPWGPFQRTIDQGERKARLRSLRACVRLLTGERGKECAYRLLKAEIDGEEALDAAEAEFGRLGSYDQRRVLASYRGLLP